MKPVITFVLGAVLATAIALMVVKREPAPAPVVQQPVRIRSGSGRPAPPRRRSRLHPVQIPAVTPAPARPSRAVPQKDTRASHRPSQSSSPTFSARRHHGLRLLRARIVRARQLRHRISPAASQQTTSTNVGSQGGPPQTTLHMPPPPPDGGRPARTPSPPLPPEFRNVTIPAGTLLSVRVDQKLSSDTVHSGDSFRASWSSPWLLTAQ